MSARRKHYGPSRRGGEVERRLDHLVRFLGPQGRPTRAELCDGLAARLGGRNKVVLTLDVAVRRELVALDRTSRPGRFALTEAGQQSLRR